MKVFVLRLLIFVALGFVLPVSARAAALRLSPSSGSFGVGSVFTVSIVLDTAGAAVQGVDVDRLHYNPSLLEVLDDNPSQSGVQITAGALMPVTVANSVDAAGGRILFSQITTGGTNFSGSGTLAQIRFLARATGSANVAIDFTPGSTSDSNVASLGQDVLSSVGNGSYTITAGAPPAPAPTPTPAPPGAPRAPSPQPPLPALKHPPSAPTPPAPVPSPVTPRAPSSFLPAPINAAFEFLKDIPDNARDPVWVFAISILLLFLGVGWVVLRRTLWHHHPAVPINETEDRMHAITSFITQNMTTRTRDEIVSALTQRQVSPAEIEEAFRRLWL